MHRDAILYKRWKLAGRKVQRIMILRKSSVHVGLFLSYTSWDISEANFDR